MEIQGKNQTFVGFRVLDKYIKPDGIMDEVKDVENHQCPDKTIEMRQ